MGAVRSTIPASQQPQLCTLVVDSAPEGEDWLSEIKFDGYRLLVAIDDRSVRLLTRNGHDWSDRMPALHAEFKRLGLKSAMLDGELVALRPDGVSSFPGLQAALKAGLDSTLTYYAFDLLFLDGWDLRSCPLIERKRLLETAVPWNATVRYSSHHEGQAKELYQHACRMRLEGIVCKRADGPYRSGRGAAWVKVKCGQREEFVVIGYTLPGGSRVGIGGLQLCYYDTQGDLQYAGGVGTGFSDRELVTLRDELAAIEAPAPRNLLYAGDPLDPTIVWIRPELVAEIRFTDWSGAGRVRHASYLGLREDKPAAEVIRPVADPEATRGVYQPRRGVKARKGWHGAVPPRRAAALVAKGETRKG